MSTIGAAIVVGKAPKTIRACILSFIDHVDQAVVVYQDDTDEVTLSEIKSIQNPKLEVYNFGQWIDDFAAKRNFSFSKLKTDWYFWCDADDVVINPQKMRELVDTVPPDVGFIWMPYHYASDEFGNVYTLYVRERLLRATCGWLWRGRLHETTSPLKPCGQYSTNECHILHNHTADQSNTRGERNFHILDIMLKEDPNDKRVWLYLGHQHFAASNWLKASEWYLKFGLDGGAAPIERWQALCYCTRALREMKDRQCVDVSLMAIDLYPQYRDGYLELAQSYMVFGEWDKAIHFALLSDTKLIVDPPPLIFVNPLDYSYNKYCLLAECYSRKGQFNESIGYLREAHKIRPVPMLLESIARVEGMIEQQNIKDGIKILSLHLLRNCELVRLKNLLDSMPFWYRDTEDYAQISGGILQVTSNIKDEPELAESEDKKSVVINIGRSLKPVDVLKEMDKKYEKVTVVAPVPFQGSKQFQVYTQNDIENLLTSGEGRRILNLQVEPERIIAEYENKPADPNGLAVRIYLGQGLEHWSPKTIKEVGCGGSETWAAMMAKELAQRGCNPLIFAMDNQVWDGVVYRDFNQFQNLSPHHLFISSRVPDVLNNQIPAIQKWLWVHDICCWERLTPDIASQLSFIVGLSHWHIDHLKRVYPFLKDCEVVDMDDQDKTYEDTWTANTWYADEKCGRLPKMAIIGDAIDVSRFSAKEEKVKNRFIWCSSADRGLEELLKMWPLLKAKLPDATLKIFYGWEYFDHSLHIPEQRLFKERIRELVKQDGVEWCGRVGQDILAKEMLRAEALIYPPPHQFRETYGITFLEAQAAGVLCFYRKNGALGETIGNRGIPLEMDATPEQIVETVVNTLSDPKSRDKIELGVRYAQGRSWGKQAEKVLALYRSALC